MPAGNTFHERLLSLTISTFILLYFYTVVRPVGAVPKNISIDDQNGDEHNGQIPIYAPGGGAWANEKCAGCGVKPDTNQLFDHTAMASTYMPDLNPAPVTADFDFNGTAIYIFFTLFYNEGNGTTVNTECNFTLDNEAPVFFNHSGDPIVPISAKRDYHALVYSKAGLEYKTHHIRISMSDVSYHVFLSFDYALYTIDEVDAPASPTTSHAGTPVTPSQSSLSPSSSATFNTSKPAVGIILGGILGGLAVLIVFLGLFWLYRRDNNRRRSGSPSPTATRPFVYPPMTDSSVSSVPQTRGVDTPFPLSTADVLPSSSQLLASTPSGLNGRASSVKRRLRDAHQCLQTLTAEVYSASSRPTKYRATTSRTTDELMEEIRGLRRDIRILEQSQRPPLDPPPQYDE